LRQLEVLERPVVFNVDADMRCARDRDNDAIA
jgi:hypothetical protein